MSCVHNLIQTEDTNMVAQTRTDKHKHKQAL